MSDKKIDELSIKEFYVSIKAILFYSDIKFLMSYSDDIRKIIKKFLEYESTMSLDEINSDIYMELLNNGDESNWIMAFEQLRQIYNKRVNE